MTTPAGNIWSGVVAPALCLDLDGTVRYSKSNGLFIQDPSDIALFPDVEARIWEYRDNGYIIMAISNQAGVAHGYKTVEQVEDELSVTISLFNRNPFHLAKQCYHDGAGNRFPYNKRSLLRKPDIGMLALMEVEAFRAGYLIDWDESLFVGDRPEDAACAANARISFQSATEFFQRSETPHA